MTTVRVEAIHPKCLASLPGPQVLAGCECKEWEGHQSWWLCAHHDSFNDGCWAVADAEPKTWEELVEAGVTFEEWDAYGTIIYGTIIHVPGFDDHVFLDRRDCGWHLAGAIKSPIEVGADAPRKPMTDLELRATITDLLKGNE
jgi:hypothetical protein